MTKTTENTDTKRIIAAQFRTDNNGDDEPEYGGREYSYYSTIDLEVGDIVEVPTRYGKGRVRISRVGLKESEIDERIMPYMKTIESRTLPEDEGDKSEKPECTKFKTDYFQPPLMSDDRPNMGVLLNIKVKSEFFWLRSIKGVNIGKCCAECFIGNRYGDIYNKSYNNQTPCTIEAIVKPDDEAACYYLCGLAKGYNYPKNTHIAFVYSPGETLEVETDQIKATISNAKRIDFQSIDYVPNPLGEFSKRQRRCRNWIFANFLRDGKLKEYLENNQ